jgi:predicted ABC-type ATPase
VHRSHTVPDHARGHFVADADVRRRYKRSIANLADGLRVADIAKVYDNSGNEHRLVLTVRSGIVISRAKEIPDWA